MGLRSRINHCIDNYEDYIEKLKEIALLTNEEENITIINDKLKLFNEVYRKVESNKLAIKEHYKYNIIWKHERIPYNTLENSLASLKTYTTTEISGEGFLRSIAHVLKVEYSKDNIKIILDAIEKEKLVADGLREYSNSLDEFIIDYENDNL
jgi:hypothetical protein